MRAHQAATAPAILCGALAPLAAPRAQEGQVPVCPSPETAQRAAQDRGAALPEGCRRVRVTRVDTPAGLVCGVDFATGDRGVGGIVAGATTTQWWTACANLRIQ